MKLQSSEKNGIVAILDALGVANYTDPQKIQEFIDSSDLLLETLLRKYEGLSVKFETEQVKTYTFNDTILVLLESRNNWRSEILTFVAGMRKFFVDSLMKKILYRGSIAIGQYVENAESHTVLGDAVSDSAAWYDKADWIGIMATPHASILIEKAKYEHEVDKKESWEGYLVDYDVPMMNKGNLKLKVVNWPKIFFISDLSPVNFSQDPRAKLIDLLSEHKIPYGTEGKYLNTISFFDSIVKKQNLRFTKSDSFGTGFST
jgi:hypothetical protein